MMLATKKRTLLFAAITVYLFLATLLPAVAQPSRETYTYNMAFDHNGVTTVEILYNTGFAGSGTSWVVVPKNFTETSVTALKGKITSTARGPYYVGGASQTHPFYDNLTFSYDSVNGPFSMSAKFNITYGAMIVEPNGFFYSPQIAVPESATVEATLTFPDGVESVSESQPSPTRVDSAGPRLEMLFNPSSESRIVVTFTVSWPKETSHIGGGKIDGEVPTRYVDLGNGLISLYQRALPLMDDLFGSTVDRISMRFFAPLSIPQLSIGGYTPIDPNSFQAGSIFLNLFYFRFLPGTIETIAIHELTHQYLAHVGVSPQLLWVHEGLANNVAVQMGKPLGYDSNSTDADLEAAAKPLNGNYGMIQYWQPGGTVFSLFQYYAASYDVFKTLAQGHGGLSMYSKFFRGIQQLNGGLKSTNVAVYQLSVAAGANLVSQFREWGFELVDISNLAARIAQLGAEAQLYGPLLPFRAEALSQLDQAQRSMDSSPEVAMGHITIAAFYIETVPMIIAGLLLLLILLAVVAMLVGRRKKRATLPDYMKA
jgi:hypothetical protein